MKNYSATRYLAALGLAALLAACASTPKKKPAPPPPAPPPPAPVVQAPPVVQPQAPKRYVVKKGDTLWGIASMYLADPWRWPDIWYANPDIRNPHLIYPGDVLILGYLNGKPTITVERQGKPVTEAPTGLPVEKLTPQVRYKPLEEAVPALPLTAIQAFLSKTRVIDADELEHAGYLLRSLDGRPAIGAGGEVYARGLTQKHGSSYDLYRLGQPYIDPETGDKLGYQATYIGTGQVERWGDPEKMVLTSTVQEALPGDRFLPITEEALYPSFLPHAPAKAVRGQIMAVLGGVQQIGQFQVVVLNRGTADGLDPGTVLRIFRRGVKVDDPYASGWFSGSVKLPDESSGTLMVFRSFNHVSYGLIMRATREIHLDDIVKNP
ncbi:MAG TPA: LysM peptidoglycan-binding domain-containing protein [Gammaproteobacteria bacterium]|nr:LysM peptidoglycan-binding domain-containing protein [Gammaproteobacteria bacterium]